MDIDNGMLIIDKANPTTNNCPINVLLSIFIPPMIPLTKMKKENKIEKRIPAPIIQAPFCFLYNEIIILIRQCKSDPTVNTKKVNSTSGISRIKII